MEQIQYTISDTAKLLKVETHVLRYWEEELGLDIPRNKMGHRVYHQKQIQLFKEIIDWKEQGLSLKEILADSRTHSWFSNFIGCKKFETFFLVNSILRHHCSSIKSDDSYFVRTKSPIFSILG